LLWLQKAETRARIDYLTSLDLVRALLDMAGWMHCAAHIEKSKAAADMAGAALSVVVAAALPIPLDATKALVSSLGMAPVP